MTKLERAQWMRRLSSWQTAQSMIDKAQELNDRFGSEVLAQPRIGFFKEAFCAGQFAKLRSADQVRLIYPDERPDFELRWGIATEAFELVEADTVGRRRGDEYRSREDSDTTSRPFPEEDWLAPTEAAAILQTAAALKSDGRYDPACRLLIYLNPSEFGIHQAAIEALMKPATKLARDCFAEVWIMWKGKAYRVH